MEQRAALNEVDRLRLVVETQRLINAAVLDTDDLMRVVTERARLMTNAEGAAVELADGTDMVYRAVSGTAEGSLGTRLSIHNSLSGLCVRLGTSLLCEDSERDPRVDREACGRIGVRSLVVVPLMRDGTAIGVLKVMSSAPRRFVEDDAELLALMAGFIADALTNASNHGALGHQALHDSLTGLPNRTLLVDRISQALLRAQRHDEGVAVFFLDLDGFKAVNDTLGHDAGDRVLVDLAERMRAILRSGETLARFGGDEFVLVCEDVSESVVEAVRQRVIGVVGDVDKALGGVGLGVSIGAAWSADARRSPDDLLADADSAMFHEKRGRGHRR